MRGPRPERSNHSNATRERRLNLSRICSMSRASPAGRSVSVSCHWTLGRWLRPPLTASARPRSPNPYSSTFSLMLHPAPCSAGGGVQTALIGEMHAEATALDGVRILLVEDEPESRDVLTAVLRLHGATVSAVGSSKEALKTLGDQCPDVLISDIAMPEGDGYELMRAVRALPAEAGGQVPAIALSAYVRVDDSRESIAAGFSVHLPKPIDPGVLVHTVAQLRKPA